MNLLLYSLFAGFWIAGLIVMIEGLNKATEACEDDAGFHYREFTKEPEHSFEVALSHRGT